jgi:2-oxoglutarate ferredoxin oxidoreductase subunit alpha
MNFMVGGEAGQGVQSLGYLLAKVMARGGYHVFADQDYESRVRGGHNFFRIRIKDSPVGAISEPVDMLLALDGNSIELHRKELKPDGVAIYDAEKIKAGGSNLLGVPLERLAEQAGGKVMVNTVALGAALGLLRYDFAPLEQLLREHFKTDKIRQNNIRAAQSGYQHAQTGFKGGFRRLQPAAGTGRLLLHGNEAIALGALAAGCRFMSAYPMTPASSIMEYFANKAEACDLVMVHAEDEIAAMNMAIGAAFAGVRAMTATSGSGFCLMAEGLGLAGITETPVVAVNAQRPGPAVGLPTRTEQGDLEFVLHAHHGDFPRAVLAPATAEEAFWSTVKAFNIADRYQLPVIILTDHYLAASYTTVDGFDLSQVTIDRGRLFSAKTEAKARSYKRHLLTKSGISPRAFPGLSQALVVTDSDEHDEAGHLTESAVIRTAQMQKRLSKLSSMKKEVSSPTLSGLGRAETTLIGWGSTRGAIREAAEWLRQEGTSVNSLHLSEIWPFPAEAVAEVLNNAQHSYVIENNAVGQLARLIRRETGMKASRLILKFDGRPFTPDYIARAVRAGGV